MASSRTGTRLGSRGEPRQAYSESTEARSRIPRGTETCLVEFTKLPKPTGVDGRASARSLQGAGQASACQADEVKAAPLARATLGAGATQVPASGSHPNNLNLDPSGGHRVSCHRCGNMRKKNVLCQACPHIFCQRCSEKLVQEWGADVFEQGCIVCKRLCCCTDARDTQVCTRLLHCYKKCVAEFKNKGSSEGADGAPPKACLVDVDDSVEIVCALLERGTGRGDSSPVPTCPPSKTSGKAAVSAKSRPPPFPIPIGRGSAAGEGGGRSSRGHVNQPGPEQRAGMSNSSEMNAEMCPDDMAGGGGPDGEGGEDFGQQEDGEGGGEGGYALSYGRPRLASECILPQPLPLPVHPPSMSLDVLASSALSPTDAGVAQGSTTQLGHSRKRSADDVGLTQASSRGGARAHAGHSNPSPSPSRVQPSGETEAHARPEVLVGGATAAGLQAMIRGLAGAGQGGSAVGHTHPGLQLPFPTSFLHQGCSPGGLCPGLPFPFPPSAQGEASPGLRLGLAAGMAAGLNSMYSLQAQQGGAASDTVPDSLLAQISLALPFALPSLLSLSFNPASTLMAVDKGVAGGAGGAVAVPPSQEAFSLLPDLPTHAVQGSGQASEEGDGTSPADVRRGMSHMVLGGGAQEEDAAMFGDLTPLRQPECAGEGTGH